MTEVASYWSAATFENREIVSEGSHNFLSFPLTGGSRSWRSPVDASRSHANVAVSSRYGMVAVAVAEDRGEGGSAQGISLFRQDDLLRLQDNDDEGGDSDVPPALPDASVAVWTADPGFHGPYLLCINDTQGGLAVAVEVVARLALLSFSMLVTADPSLRARIQLVAPCGRWNGVMAH